MSFFAPLHTDSSSKYARNPGETIIRSPKLWASKQTEHINNMTNERLERVIDLVEIKDLLVREKSYRDSLNWTALREVWHPDASRTNINISW